MTVRLAAFLLILLSALALAACGGDDDSSGDPTGSATATASSGPSGTPPPVADPELASGLNEIGRGDLGEIEVPVGGVYYIDPATLETEGSAEPSCEGFVFAFAWQVTDPYPPEEDALEWQVQREGGNATLSEEPSGEDTSGCDPVQAVNNGEEALTLAVKYAIGVP
jgi:hypothetical protein